MRRTRLLIALVAGTLVVASTFAGPAQAAGVSITGPSSAASGAPAAFSGTGFPAYASVNFYLERAGTNNFFCTLAANSSGSIPTQTCTIPTYLIAGSYDVHADDGQGDVADAPHALALVPSTSFTSPFSSQAVSRSAAGSTISIAGHGFAPSSTVKIKLGTTTVTTTPSPVVTDTNGTFSAATFSIPASQVVGPVSITATDASGNTTANSVQIYAAAITAKTTGTAGSPYLITGTGWPGADSINLYLSRGGSNNFICTVRSDDSGTIAQQTCTIPTYLPVGAYTLNVSDLAVTVAQPYTMTPQLLAVSTNNSQVTGSVGAGSTISLTGHGYAPGSALTVKIGTKTVTTTPSPASTDSSGTFSGVVITVPSKEDVGKQTITTKDASGDTATYKVSVYAAKVTVAAAGPAGSPQVIGGSGWPASESINAYVSYGAGNAFIGTLHTDSTGAIVPQSFTIPTYLPAGNDSILLTDGFVTASAPFNLQPELLATNTSGQPLAGAAPGTAVNLVGHGYSAGATISATLGTKKLSLVPVTPGTDSSGSFTGVSFSVPTVTAGPYTLTVTDSAGKKASVQFTVS